MFLHLQRGENGSQSCTEGEGIEIQLNMQLRKKRRGLHAGRDKPVGPLEVKAGELGNCPSRPGQTTQDWRGLHPWTKAGVAWGKSSAGWSQSLQPAEHSRCMLFSQVTEQCPCWATFRGHCTAGVRMDIVVAWSRSAGLRVPPTVHCQGQGQGSCWDFPRETIAHLFEIYWFKVRITERGKERERSSVC